MGLFKRRKQQEEGSSQERLTVGQALRKERFKQGKAGVEDASVCSSSSSASASVASVS